MYNEQPQKNKPLQYIVYKSERKKSVFSRGKRAYKQKNICTSIFLNAANQDTSQPVLILQYICEQFTENVDKQLVNIFDWIFKQTFYPSTNNANNIYSLSYKTTVEQNFVQSQLRQLKLKPKNPPNWPLHRIFI
jgi:hypothetical protein